MLGNGDGGKFKYEGNVLVRVGRGSIALHGSPRSVPAQGFGNAKILKRVNGRFAQQIEKA